MADKGSKLIHKDHILIEDHTAEYSVYGGLVEKLL